MRSREPVQRRPSLNVEEIPVIVKGLALLLTEYVNARDDLKTATVAFKALYRLLYHTSGRPNYPDPITWDTIADELERCNVPIKPLDEETLDVHTNTHKDVPRNDINEPAPPTQDMRTSFQRSDGLNVCYHCGTVYSQKLDACPNCHGAPLEPKKPVIHRKYGCDRGLPCNQGGLDGICCISCPRFDVCTEPCNTAEIVKQAREEQIKPDSCEHMVNGELDG